MKRTDMDNHSRYSRKWKNSLTAGILLALSLGGTACAMPTGGQIQSGQGAIAQNGKTMTVTQQSGKMAVDWTQFNIAKDEAVKFAQPGRDAVALNRITGGQKSVIDGALSANGNLFLVNPNGVVFSKTATVDVGSLVASTAQLNDPFMKSFAGSTANLNLTIGEGNTSTILNEGTITSQGGLVALHAAQVENTGTISNPGGTVALAAAKQMTLSPDSDGKLNYAVDGELAQAKALNSGRIQADGGYVVMTAKSAQDLLGTVVNNTGTLEAKTLRKDEKGQILLDGGQSGQVEVSGTLDASGMEDGQSAGNIKVIGQKTIVHDDTNLLAKGSVDGGKIETSGDVLNLGDNLNIDAKGVNGKAGEWLLDPLDVIIADKDPTTTSNYDKADKKTAADSDFTNGSASIGYNDPAATDANASSVNSAVTWISTDMVEKMLNAGTNVTVQAAATNGNANIIVSSNIDKTLGNDATLTLDAMRNITVNGNISSTSNKLNVVLNADSNGDKIGAVIINANINTNGGDFTSASGGAVTYTSDSNTKGYGKGTLSGKADSAGHTVGTYFGHVDSSGTADGATDDRLIQTKGGKITLNGEVAIGLNGGTLTLDSSNSNGEKGDITVTGIINSGNSYGAYVYGTTTWDELTADKVNEYLTSDTVPAYHYQGVNYVKNSDGTYKTTTDAADFSNGEPHYTFDKETDTQNIRWLGDGSSTAVSITKGKGYSSVIITEGKMSTQEYLQYVAVSDPAGFLSRYMTSNPTITVGSTSYALTVSSVTVNGVSNNALGYKVGNKFTTLTQQQIQSLAEGAHTLAKNSTDTTAMSNGITAYTNLTNDIKRLIASNWFVSETLAKYDPKTKTYNNGKSAVGDSYLATITTVLENSLTTPNGQQILWAGGRGSGVLKKTGSTNNDKLYPYSYWGMPDDPTYQDGMYWVTGPEGEANNGKGTQFYSNAGSDWGTVSLGSDGKTYTYNQGNNVYGYVNWDTWPDKATATDKNRVDVTRSQPDNSSPFLSVGYGTTGKWDDAAMGGATTIGFIKETNLANSSLNIKAGGTVNLEGDLGKAKALDTVNIESTGTVTLGNPNNTATTYHNGTVYADHGVYISGGTVSVGGEIHSGTTDKTASASDITSRTDGYQNTAFQLDSVTIKSAGDLTVHGVESDGYTGSDSTLKGGKIKLTSTGTEGVITLGDGVDYNGKNTNGGVLKAASTANDAVVIDARGKKSKFVNETTGTKAIDTQGKWKIYSASPEQNTFRKNLNSGTDAQWTSDSTKFTANGSDENKFIFQTTPTITLYVEDKVKTYGDDVTKQLPDYMMNRKEFTGVDGKLHNVNEFTDAFQEKEYTNYISVPEGQSITVTSVGGNGADGAVGTATRTGGNYTATEKSGADGKNAVYDLNVNLNGATAKDGYVLKSENATLEIVKRKASITGTGTQTYGDTDGTIKNWTDTQTNIADGNTVSYTTSIKSDSDYTKNQGSRNTADHGTYNDSVSFDNLKITDTKGNEVNISDNYDLTTTGTIDVAKAKLTVNTDGKTTTYGTVDESYTSKLDDSTKALNGDDAKKLISDLGLTYKTDAYQDSNGDGKYDRTNHVKYTSDGKEYDSYTLDVANTNTLKNYDVTVNDSTVTLERAKATVDTDNVTTTYGTVDKNYTSHFNTAVNGDNPNKLLADLNLTYATQAYTDDTHTNNVQEGGYKLDVAKTADLRDYDVSVNPSNVTLDKATLVIDTTGGSKDYGDVTGVKADLDKSASFHVKDSDKKTVNGDDADKIRDALNISVKSDALVENGTRTNDVKDGGYEIKADYTSELQNYKVETGTVGKEQLNRVDLYVDSNDLTKFYGDAQGVLDGLDSKERNTLIGLVNGDEKKEDSIRTDIGIKNSSPAVYTKDGKPYTKDVGDYGIKTALTNQSITNYNVKTRNAGKVTLTPVEITVDNEMIQTYGSKDRSFKEVVDPGLVNGDKISTDGLKMAPKAGGKYETNKGNRTTADAGTYEDDLAFSGGGIVREDGTTDASKNYKVTIKGDIIVKKADLTVNTKDVTTPFGTVKFTTSGVQGLTNGDEKNVSDLKFNYGSYGNAYLDNNSYTNAPGRYEFTTETTNQYLDFLKNYNLLGGDATVTITPVDKPVKPDITPEKPNPVPAGKGEVEEPSMDDFRGEEEHRDGGRTWYREKKSIPFFKVLDGKVTNYGTFDVESMPEKVEITPSGMRLPEPDQPETQHREYTTTLTLSGGDGSYRLVYNGVSFNIHAVDAAARQLLEAGDPKKNEELSEAALYTGFQKMGLGLEDLKAVYIRFN